MDFRRFSLVIAIITIFSITLSMAGPWHRRKFLKGGFIGVGVVPVGIYQPVYPVAVPIAQPVPIPYPVPAPIYPVAPIYPAPVAPAPFFHKRKEISIQKEVFFGGKK